MVAQPVRLGWPLKPAFLGSARACKVLQFSLAYLPRAKYTSDGFSEPSAMVMNSCYLLSKVAPNLYSPFADLVLISSLNFTA